VFDTLLKAAFIIFFYLVLPAIRRLTGF